MVMNLAASWETSVPSQGRGDPLEEGMVTHSSIPAWEIPWTEEPGGIQFMELQRIGHNRTTKHTALEEYVYLKRVFHTVLWIGEMESSILQ